MRPNVEGKKIDCALADPHLPRLLSGSARPSALTTNLVLRRQALSPGAYGARREEDFRRELRAPSSLTTTQTQTPLEHAARDAAAGYASGDWARAVAGYTRAIDLADCDTQAVTTLLANRSAARLQDGAAAAAAHDAALSLTARPADWRPRLRLARALGELGRQADAGREAAHVLRLSAVPAQASQEAAALLRRAAAEASSAPVAASAAEAAAHSAVTGAGFSMADGRQTLRVHLCAPLPCALRCGCWHTIAVRLTNEMGLFDAEAFAAAASGRVRLDAVALSSEAGPLRLTLRQAADPAPPPDAAPASLPTHPGDGASGGVLLQLHRGRATAEVRLELREERESSSGCCSCARRGQHAAGRPQPEHAAEQCAAALAVLRATVEATVGDGARAGSAPACGSAGAGAGVGRRGAADATRRRAAPPPAMPPLGALSLPLPLLGRSAGGGAEGGSAGGGSVGGGGDAADEPAADIALRDALRPTPPTHHLTARPRLGTTHPPPPCTHLTARDMALHAYAYGRRR